MRIPFVHGTWDLHIIEKYCRYTPCSLLYVRSNTIDRVNGSSQGTAVPSIYHLLLCLVCGSDVVLYCGCGRGGGGGGGGDDEGGGEGEGGANFT